MTIGLRREQQLFVLACEVNDGISPATVKPAHQLLSPAA